MEMEFMAEFTERMSPDRDRIRDRRIVKGKRTKRQRPCSPFGMYTSAASGNSRCNSSGDGAYCLIDDVTPDRSPVLTLSSETSTEEDEDMANCLIMLARSVSVSVSPVKEEKSDQIRQRTEKLSSRRFTEMTATATATVTAATAGGKGGVYVYECKTCNRTFPSFQALGGHRASHKRPKVNVEEKKSSSVDFPPSMTEYSENDHEHDYDQRKVVEDEESKRSMMLITNNVEKSSSPSPSRGNLVQTGTITITNNKRKIHECSICGSEFSSGQALGGHMRKHRPIPPSVNRTGSVINTDEILTADQSIEKSPGGISGMLSLDLNFPPPEMIDGDVQSKFQFTANPSQHMLFSSPALIDCHY